MVAGLCFQARHNFPCNLDVAEPDGGRRSWLSWILGWIHVDNVSLNLHSCTYAIGLGDEHHSAMVDLYAVFKRDGYKNVLDVQDVNDVTWGKQHRKEA